MHLVPQASATALAALDVEARTAQNLQGSSLQQLSAPVKAQDAVVGAHRAEGAMAVNAAQVA